LIFHHSYFKFKCGISKTGTVGTGAVGTRSYTITHHCSVMGFDFDFSTHQLWRLPALVWQPRVISSVLVSHYLKSVSHHPELVDHHPAMHQDFGHHIFHKP
jgi:hypothetical protein